MMQSRALTIEDGKDPSALPRTHSKGLPLRILKFFALFLVLGLRFSIVSMLMIRYWGVQNVVSTVRSEFQPCLEESGSLERWIRPPSNLMHTMTDKELFWQAAFIPRINEYPFERIPKIAFMFLTRGPLPLSLLWERFLKGHEGRYSIYVHSLPSSSSSSSSVDLENFAETELNQTHHFQLAETTEEQIRGEDVEDEDRRRFEVVVGKAVTATYLRLRERTRSTFFPANDRGFVVRARVVFCKLMRFKLMCPRVLL